LNDTYGDAAAAISYLTSHVTAATISGTSATAPLSNWTETDTYSVQPGSYTFTATIGALPSGYADEVSTIATVSVEVVIAPFEITAYDALPAVNGGSSGSATYADADAVITYLTSNYTAVGITGARANAPISNWTETDTYSTNPGSYTFTATVGTPPSGFVDAVDTISTVSVEVVIASAATVNISVIPGVTAPVYGGTPVTAITETDQYTGTVSWSPADSNFGQYTTYTATITLTAKSGYTLTGVSENFFTVAGTTADTNAASSGVITATFPITSGTYGIGSASDPWQIKYIEDLASIGGTHALTGLTWASTDYYILASSLSFGWAGSYRDSSATGTDWNGDGSTAESILTQFTTSKGWMPIGSSESFKGHFDGNENIISSLFINRPNDDYQALFGEINGATITDLFMESVNVTGSGEVAALAADVTNSTISH
jgi:hypothetical protein